MQQKQHRIVLEVGGLDNSGLFDPTRIPFQPLKHFDGRLVAGDACEEQNSGEGFVSSGDSFDHALFVMGEILLLVLEVEGVWREGVEMDGAIGDGDGGVADPVGGFGGLEGFAEVAVVVEAVLVVGNLECVGLHNYDGDWGGEWGWGIPFSCKQLLSVFIETEMKMEREQSKSPEYLGQGIIKSQKNINSSSNFHIKTEHDRTDDDHHRSPDITRAELRETWRRPRMPYNNKLPEVFNQQKKNRNQGRAKPDMIRHIDKMVENSEYKEAQKYLEPLKFKEDDKKDKASENRNPLNPVKKMMKMVTKLGEDFKINEIEDMSVDRFRNGRAGFRGSECITLEVVKRGHNTGTIKKMLHVPTLTLVCVREEPITWKESRNFIRDWTDVWREKLSGEGMPFVILHDVKFNYPEGAISIFMEYFKSRSLLNLLDLTTTLPESVIREVFSQVLQILDVFYLHTKMHFGGISPSQIMFTEDNKVKLSLGLFYHIPNLEAYSIYHIRGVQKNNPFDFNSTHSKFMKTTLDKPINLDIERSIDVFKVGLTMLNCAIGNFQNFEQSSQLFETLRFVFTEQGQRQIEKDNACCIIHSEQYLLQIAPQNSDTDRTFRNDRFISYLRLIKDRFSIHFLNFLCQSLKLSHTRRATLSDLIENPFITAAHDNDNRTVKIELSDLLAIGRGWSQEVFESGAQQKLDSFLGHLKTVLEHTNRQTLSELVHQHRERIYSLGKEVGLNPGVLGKRLEDILFEIVRVGR